MGKAKFTDGPWFTDQYGHVYGWSSKESARESVVLIDSRTSKATAADKRLICMAPEMLELLIEARNLLATFAGRYPEADDLFRRTTNIIRHSFAKQESLDDLSSELAVYCEVNRLPSISAGDLVRMEGLSDSHRRYLQHFIERWDAAEGAEA